MFLDAKKIKSDEVLKSQVCVFGSGPAGMTLAASLAEQGIQVLLIEAGAIEYEDWSQDLYKGRVEGDPYFALSEARLRMFGGTSNHWGGRCRPLDAHDFEKRAHVADSGWPISKADLDPYLTAACDIVEIENTFEDQQYTPLLEKTRFQYSAPIYFGEKFYDLCAESPNLRVATETALTMLEPEGEAIARARVNTRDGASWTIEADQFALCLGGIENPRMLLWVDAQHNGALNGNRDVLGTYWMEHPHTHMADVVLRDPGANFWRDGEATFSLSAQAQSQIGLSNLTFQLLEQSYSSGSKAMVADLMCVAPGLGETLMRGIGKNLVCGARMQGQIEQVPVRDNRVALGENRDSLGIPKPVLHWRRSEADRQTIIQSVDVLAQEFAQQDIGRVRPARWIRKNQAIPDDGMNAAWHHMGGTRMSDSPAHGVVDANLRVHGLNNLYVGGSSVFPTGGYANPTLTIVQMSLRLANHLATMT